MQVLLGKVLMDLDGAELLGEDKQPFTLRSACVAALLAQFEDEKNLSGEEKLKRWELAVTIKNSSDPAELKAEEIALIKKLIGKAYAAIIVGQTWKFLEGN